MGRRPLRAVQAPLRDWHRAGPDDAVITLSASDALVACAGVTLGALATSLDIDLRSGIVSTLPPSADRDCVVAQTVRAAVNLEVDVR